MRILADYLLYDMLVRCGLRKAAQDVRDNKRRFERALQRGAGILRDMKVWEASPPGGTDGAMAWELRAADPYALLDRITNAAAAAKKKARKRVS